VSTAVKLCGGVLAWVLLTSGLAKLLGGSPQPQATGSIIGYLIATAELLAAVALATKYARFGIAVAIAIALGGLGLSLAGFDANQSCGCLGDVLVSERGHLLLATGLGLVASLYWFLQEREATRSGRVGAGSS
jgi:hypothetical protein